MNSSLFILGVALALASLLFGLIFIYFRNFQPTDSRKIFALPNQRPYRSRPSKVSFELGDRSNDKSEIRIEQVPHHLQKRLVVLLNGDRNTANRLMNAVKDRNPSKSAQWCAEKVIFDLQRDRGRY